MGRAEKQRGIAVFDAVRGGEALARLRRHPMRPLRPLVALGTALVFAYVAVIRPWTLSWGSTEEERARPLPGDDLFPNPTHITTRALTIQGPPREIWPWLVQMEQDRAGFYTHNWVEKLLMSGISDVHEIHAEWQNLSVGDLLRTNREIQPGHPLGWPVAIVEPELTARDVCLRPRSRHVAVVGVPVRAAGVRAPACLHGDRPAPGPQKASGKG